MTKRAQLITWLGDAHAMEVGIITTLEKHIADAKGHPKVRAGLTKHLKETKRHASEMKKALAAMGGSHPVLREGVGKLASLAAGLVTTTARDTLVKNAIADFATEHFEIACYSSLVVTATALGEKKIAATCKGILREEKAMAKALSEQLPMITESYLATLDEEATDEDNTPAPKRSAAKRGKGRSSAAKKPKAPARRK